MEFGARRAHGYGAASLRRARSYNRRLRGYILLAYRKGFRRGGVWYYGAQLGAAF